MVQDAIQTTSTSGSAAVLNSLSLIQCQSLIDDAMVQVTKIYLQHNEEIDLEKVFDVINLFKAAISEHNPQPFIPMNQTISTRPAALPYSGSNNNQLTITSVELAQMANKPHNDLMKAIRKMEPAWSSVNGGRFSLVDYTDAKGERRPCYILTKTESLYVISKFNDETRAKLVLRWEQLEREHAQQFQVPGSFREALLLAAQQQEQIETQRQQIGQQQAEILQLTSAVSTMEQKVSYLDKILSCTSTVKVKTIAQDYGMTAIAFNQLLHRFGIQYKCGDVWVLYAKYISEGYVKDVPFEYTRTNGTTAMASNMQWTQKGRMFLYNELKAHGILPLIECPNN